MYSAGIPASIFEAACCSRRLRCTSFAVSVVIAVSCGSRAGSPSGGKIPVMFTTVARTRDKRKTKCLRSNVYDDGKQLQVLDA